PDWTATVRSTFRIRNADVAFLVEARKGGKIFSATNLWGSRAGTLESTVLDRETGKLIPGIDSITGAANATTVSVEDYFHALGGIHEPWVYDASYAKLRELRISYETGLTRIPVLAAQTLRISLVGRNLWTWAKAPNIDPETALSAGTFQGFEMGQLPSSRSLGLQLSITP
ncbi:MAG: SusC/RagA family TonB-linked outer membrane protein, partial [Bryobacteraceae bacterium]